MTMPDNAQRLVDDDARQCDDGDLGRPPADVHHHVAHGLADVEPDADGRRHGLCYQIHLLGPGVLGGVSDGPLFHLGNATRHAHHHAANGGQPVFLDLLQEALNHLLGHLEVGDHPVLERPDGFDVLVGALVHLKGLVPELADLAGRVVDGHDARLVEDNPFSANVHQSIRRPQVDGDVLREVEKH